MGYASNHGRYSSRDYGGWAPYVPVAERRRKALQHAKKLQKKGETLSPVAIEGRTIAKSFWGKAWCVNLESYRDYENRLERGRRYARNGSVIDLKVLSGKITALVSGSSIYKIKIEIRPLAKKLWSEVQKKCSGEVLSVIELLQGKLSDHVMETVTSQHSGLFPTPQEISFDCSCPDSASMCKHIAATLYGVGNRLDSAPELLFTLRNVDHRELISASGKVSALTGGRNGASRKTVSASSLSQVFGIEMDDVEMDEMIPAPKAAPKGRLKASKKAAKKTAPKKAKALKKTKKTTKAKKVTKKTRTNKKG